MKRILLRVLAVGFGALILLVLLTPTLLSLGPGRRAILGAVNAKLDGRVDIRRWSLGWLRGQTVEGLDFKDRVGDTAVQFESASVSAGLFRLFARTWKLGTIEIVRPQILAVVPPAPPPPPPEGGPGPAPAPAPAPGPPPPPPPRPGRKPLITWRGRSSVPFKPHRNLSTSVSRPMPDSEISPWELCGEIIGAPRISTPISIRIHPQLRPSCAIC